MFTLEQYKEAANTIYKYMSPTPQYEWPLLSKRIGCEVWVKHENHTPINAFKIRGGLVYLNNLKNKVKNIKGIVAATRGNHGQSIAYASNKLGIKSTIIVPLNNNPEKNAAMKSFGGNLIEHGRDYQAAFEYANDYAKKEGLVMIPTFDMQLVLGVASYALELFTAVKDFDTVYASVGLGSGISGIILIRDLLGLKTKIVGVVSENANSYALSYRAKKIVCTDTANTIADGLACRCPNPEAYEIIAKGVDDIIEVSEEEIFLGIKHYYTDTHNLAEGAAASALSALERDKDKVKGKKVCLILSGANVNKDIIIKALSLKE